MTYSTSLDCQTTAGWTGDLVTTSGYGVSYPYHYCPSWPCPICNPPTYVPYPVYVNPQPTTIILGKIEISPDIATKEDVKELKEEIKKLRKDLAKK